LYAPNYASTQSSDIMKAAPDHAEIIMRQGFAGRGGGAA
jgi:hypothetical protein